MTPEEKIKALAELDGFKTGKTNDGYGEFEFPIIEGCVGQFNDYLTSYDAIIPLIQRQDSDIQLKLLCQLEGSWIDATPIQLADALLVATGKMK